MDNLQSKTTLIFTSEASLSPKQIKRRYNKCAKTKKFIRLFKDLWNAVPKFSNATWKTSSAMNRSKNTQIKKVEVKPTLILGPQIQGLFNKMLG